MNLNTLDKENIAAAVAWAEANPARSDNALEILNANPNAYQEENSESSGACKANEPNKVNGGKAD